MYEVKGESRLISVNKGIFNYILELHNLPFSQTIMVCIPMAGLPKCMTSWV